MNSFEYLGKILGIKPELLQQAEEVAKKPGTIERLAEQNTKRVAEILAALKLSRTSTCDEVFGALYGAIRKHEEELTMYMAHLSGNTEFEKAAKLALNISGIDGGFFLKKEFAAKILRQCKPQNLLSFLHYNDIEELLAKEDVTEAFAALRFTESQEWMHSTFEQAYSSFTAAEFEFRPIEIKVLGDQWHEIALKFVAKKHHNVSHLKEFGVIFINPIKEDLPGKFLRDFALLLHYCHEIEFYSKLFKKHSTSPDFAAHLKSLLRGDVKEAAAAGAGEWLIVQRYLWKENSQDPRLFLPHVNPESVHWMRGERDLAKLGLSEPSLDLELWGDYDWVADFFTGYPSPISFDMEDNAMGLVSQQEGKHEHLYYHQREALWTKLFEEFAGGEGEMEKLLLENFDRGIITPS